MHRDRPSPLTALALVGAVLPLARGILPSSSARGDALQTAVSLESTVADRTSCFVLEQVEANPAGSGSSDAPTVRSVGLLRSRVLTLADGLQLEWDVQFPAEGTRVLHVERSDAEQTSLIWREFRPNSGRTLRLEWPDGQPTITALEWGGRQRLVFDLTVPADGVLPLHLIEMLRCGTWPEGELSCFDPLSRRFERARLESTRTEAGHRRYELVRADGTLAGAWEFQGEELVAIQWQGGDLSARRIPPEEYRSRAGEQHEDELAAH